MDNSVAYWRTFGRIPQKASIGSFCERAKNRPIGKLKFDFNFFLLSVKGIFPKHFNYYALLCFFFNAMVSFDQMSSKKLFFPI